jgi:Flp pilus assembly protein TadG
MIAMVVSAMMATAITTLALSPIKTQRQKSVYAASEAAAIATRKCIVDNPTTFTKDADIVQATVDSTCLTGKILKSPSDISCTVLNDYTPVGSLVNVPYAIECKQKSVTGNMAGLAWQPLYTVNSMVEASNNLKSSDFQVCLRKWIDDPSATYSSPISSENLSSKYPDVCSGISQPFNFTSEGYTVSKNSPCSVSMKISSMTPGSSFVNVVFDEPSKTCDANDP